MMKGTKLLVVLVGLGLTLIGYVLTGVMPLLATQFTIFCGAVSGLVGLYAMGNVGSQIVAAKAQTDQHKATVENGILPDPEINKAP